MSQIATILLTVFAVILLLVTMGGLKDWKEAGSWDRVRIIVPGILAVVFLTLLLTNLGSGSRIETGTTTQISVAN